MYPTIYLICRREFKIFRSKRSSLTDIETKTPDGEMKAQRGEKSENDHDDVVVVVIGIYQTTRKSKSFFIRKEDRVAKSK